MHFGFRDVFPSLVFTPFLRFRVKQESLDVLSEWLGGRLRGETVIIPSSYELPPDPT